MRSLVVLCCLLVLGSGCGRANANPNQSYVEHELYNVDLVHEQGMCRNFSKLDWYYLTKQSDGYQRDITRRQAHPLCGRMRHRNIQVISLRMTTQAEHSTFEDYADFYYAGKFQGRIYEQWVDEMPADHSVNIVSWRNAITLPAAQHKAKG